MFPFYLMCLIMIRGGMPMYAKPPKKMLIINIMDILRRYTDTAHRLSQKEIVEILENEYQMVVDRKAVKRNLMNLIEFGYNIEYSESARLNKNGEEETLYTDWYLERDFSDAELRLLVDSLLFSKHIPYSQCNSLIKKIEGLSNQYFRSKVKHIRNLPEDMPENKQLFYSIEVLNEAINKGRKVEFMYNDFGIDMKPHPRIASDGKPRKYIINPYQMVATNGRYYLICNYEKYDGVSNYRIDRISEIEMLDVTVKPAKHVLGLEHGLDLPRHMAEHIYMFAGPSERVFFRAQKYIVGEIIDWFGKDVRFSDETENEVTASVMVNLNAMRYWAMQYAPHIMVQSPQSLVNQLKKDIRATAVKYEIL